MLKSFSSVFAKLCIIIIGLFVVFALLNLWSNVTQQYGPARVMFSNVVFTRGMGDGEKDLPDEFVYAGKIKRVRSQTDELNKNFDGYKCSRGSKLFTNSKNPNLIYLYDKKEERFIPYTSQILQQYIVRINGNCYARQRSAIVNNVADIPADAVEIGKISSSVQDAIPTENFQINAHKTDYMGWVVYISSDRSQVFLLRSITEQSPAYHVFYRISLD